MAILKNINLCWLGLSQIRFTDIIVTLMIMINEFDQQFCYCRVCYVSYCEFSIDGLSSANKFALSHIPTGW